ncbi:hypothetical protein C8R46DRAFT_1305150 [Mycena filopes]|nr:hypothetical protein C8R46DRAFT_1305150 [Mycena filopes]
MGSSEALTARDGMPLTAPVTPVKTGTVAIPTAFAIKEFMQNCSGQILKALERREWNDWTREDLRLKPLEEKQARKRLLIETYPGLLTGPHGIGLTHAACLPLYILSADIGLPASSTNLAVVIVLWSTGENVNALTFFNNHLDPNATFDSFAVDGESTSKDNIFAVGEKGKGFILATQFLSETIDQMIMPPVEGNRKSAANTPHAGISFRVGAQIGELKWKKARRVGAADSLRVILDDLTPRSVAEYLPHRYHLDIDLAPDGGTPNAYDPSMETAKMREKATRILNQGQTQRRKYGLKRDDGEPLVRPDEVCIVVIGIPVAHQPEYLFSAIFGIIPPPRQWRNPGGNVQFLISAGKTLFYHRDQLVLDGIQLNRLSINYHGNLNLSSDRTMVRTDARMAGYRRDLSNNADMAFRTLPDLAIELARDVLTDDHSNALAGILVPRDKAGASQYRVAFEAALRQQTLKLFEQLDLTPVLVSYKALDIMHNSGAYLPVREYARGILLAAPVLDEFPGLDRLRAALTLVLPRVPPASITVRQYDKVYPTVVWDDSNKLFAFALPKACEEHPAPTQCVCWIGPFLQDAAKEYKTKGPAISAAKLWRAFALQMGGDTIAQAPASISATASPSKTTPMDVDKSNQPQPQAGLSLEHVGGVFERENRHQRIEPVYGRRRLPVPVRRMEPTEVLTARDGMPSTAPVIPVKTVTVAIPSQRPAPATTQTADTLNRQALSQLSQTILGYDAFKKYDALAAEALSMRQTFITQKAYIEWLKNAAGKKDGKIMELEEENRILLEDLTEHENAVLKRKTEREFKRRKVA